MPDRFLFPPCIMTPPRKPPPAHALCRRCELPTRVPHGGGEGTPSHPADAPCHRAVERARSPMGCCIRSGLNESSFRAVRRHPRGQSSRGSPPHSPPHATHRPRMRGPRREARQTALAAWASSTRPARSGSGGGSLVCARCGEARVEQDGTPHQQAGARTRVHPPVRPLRACTPARLLLARAPARPTHALLLGRHHCNQQTTPTNEPGT